MTDMASLEVFLHKSGSRERGQVWQKIAANLNGYPNFFVTLRAVREFFTTIMRKYKAKIRKKVQGTGLGGQELIEYKTLLEDLIERYEESKLKSEEEVADKKSIEKDKQTALDIRNTAMERYGKLRNVGKWKVTTSQKKKSQEEPVQIWSCFFKKNWSLTKKD